MSAPKGSPGPSPRSTLTADAGPSIKVNVTGASPKASPRTSPNPSPKPSPNVTPRHSPSPSPRSTLTADSAAAIGGPASHMRSGTPRVVIDSDLGSSNVPEFASVKLRSTAEPPTSSSNSKAQQPRAATLAAPSLPSTLPSRKQAALDKEKAEKEKQEKEKAEKAKAEKEKSKPPLPTTQPTRHTPTPSPRSTVGNPSTANAGTNTNAGSKSGTIAGVAGGTAAATKSTAADKGKACNTFKAPPGTVWGGMKCTACGVTKKDHAETVAVEMTAVGAAVPNSRSTAATATNKTTKPKPASGGTSKALSACACLSCIACCASRSGKGASGGGGQVSKFAAGYEGKQTAADAESARGTKGKGGKLGGFSLKGISHKFDSWSQKRKITVTVVVVVCLLIFALGLGLGLGLRKGATDPWAGVLATANGNVKSKSSQLLASGYYSSTDINALAMTGMNATAVAALMSYFDNGTNFTMIPGDLPGCTTHLDCRVSDLRAVCTPPASLVIANAYAALIPGFNYTGYCTCSLGYSGRFCEVEPSSLERDDLSYDVGGLANSTDIGWLINLDGRADSPAFACPRPYDSTSTSAIAKVLAGFPTRRPFTLDPTVVPPTILPGPDSAPSDKICAVFNLKGTPVPGCILFFVPNAGQDTAPELAVRLELPGSPSGTNWADYLNLNDATRSTLANPLLSTSYVAGANLRVTVVVSTASFDRVGFQLVQGANVRFATFPTSPLLNAVRPIFGPQPTYPARQPLLGVGNTMSTVGGVYGLVIRGYFPTFGSSDDIVVGAEGPSVDLLMPGARVRMPVGRAGRMDMRLLGFTLTTQIMMEVALDLGVAGHLNMFVNGAISPNSVSLVGEAYSWNFQYLGQFVDITRLKITLDGTVAGALSLNSRVGLQLTSALKVPGLPSTQLSLMGTVHGEDFGILTLNPVLKIGSLANLPCAIIGVGCGGSALDTLNSALGPLANTAFYVSLATQACQVGNQSAPQGLRLWATLAYSVPSSITSALSFFGVSPTSTISVGIQIPLVGGSLAGDMDIFFHIGNAIDLTDPNPPFFQFDWLEVGILLQESGFDVGVSVILNIDQGLEFQLYGKFLPPSVQIEGAMVGTWKNVAGITGLDIGNAGALIGATAGPVITAAGIWGTIDLGPSTTANFVVYVDPLAHKYCINANLTGWTWKGLADFVEYTSGIDLGVAADILDALSILQLNYIDIVAAPAAISLPGRTCAQGMSFTAGMDLAMGTGVVSVQVAPANTVYMGVPLAFNDLTVSIAFQNINLLLFLPYFKLSDYIMSSLESKLNAKTSVSCCCVPYIGCASGTIPIGDTLSWLQGNINSLLVLKDIGISQFSLVNAITKNAPIPLVADFCVQGNCYRGTYNVHLDVLTNSAATFGNYVKELGQAALTNAADSVADAVFAVSSVCDYISNNACVTLDVAVTKTKICIQMC